MNLYVCGGQYWQQSKSVFSVVSPSEKRELPYVWTDPLPIRTGCEHHAHVYLVKENFSMVLHRKSSEAETNGVGCPNESKCSNPSRQRVLERAIVQAVVHSERILNYKELTDDVPMEQDLEKKSP